MGWFNKKNEPEEEAVPAPKPVKAKIVGVRMAEETSGSKTYNYTKYCLLVEYENGHRSIGEFKYDDPDLIPFLYLIPMD